MSDRGRRPSEDQSPHESATAPSQAAQQQADLERYFRDTPEGRAQLQQFFRDTPDGRACIEHHLRTSEEGRAELDAHLKHTQDGRARLAEHLRASPGALAQLRDGLAEDIRRSQPSLRDAVQADAAVYASLMLTPPRLRSGVALLREAASLGWSHDTFFCQLLYRLRVRLFVRRVPLLPTILHRLCVALNQIDIGNHVLIEPGVYLPHGKVVIDGMVRIGRGTMITPWVTLGLTTTIQGPSIGRDVMIGTGAKILGPISVGDGARIAANAVVLHDVPPHTTVAGAPATVVREHDR